MTAMRILGGLLAMSSLTGAIPSKYNYLLPRSTSLTPFDPLSTSNLVVYYGKAQDTSTPSLYELCADSDVDMIVMGFVRQLNGASKQPTFGFTNACKTPTTVKGNSTVSCPDLAQNITYCQSMGKKVLISLGGSTSNLTLHSSSEAQQAANILWNVFGAGTNTTWLKPFGSNVTIDGFDFDLESGADTTYTDVLSASLQSLFKTSTNSGYISAAPLCANNTVFPSSFYANANFIWPRFYNAKACCVGSKGFNKSVTAWYNYLGSINSNLGHFYPRFYLGGLSFDNANSGYVDPDTFANATLATRKITKAKFGGVSLWEGTDGLVTKNAAGRDFLNVTKAALDTPLTSNACGRFDNGVLGGLRLIRRQMNRLTRTRSK